MDEARPEPALRQTPGWQQIVAVVQAKSDLSRAQKAGLRSATERLEAAAAAADALIGSHRLSSSSVVPASAWGGGVEGGDPCALGGPKARPEKPASVDFAAVSAALRAALEQAGGCRNLGALKPDVEQACAGLLPGGQLGAAALRALGVGSLRELAQ
ncbi:unnamed protein product, partial [Prorocentrum cordatum]